jgi:hypothetical protein
MIMDITTSFDQTIIFFGGAFDYGGGSKCYVGTNTEPLSTEFSNFVHCHTFVNCLSFCD